MNWRLISRLLGWMTFFVVLAMVVPLGLSLYYGDGDHLALLKAIGAGLAASLALYLPFRGAGGALGHLEGFAVVVAAWAMTCAAGALPYVFHGDFPTLTDAVFESVSGFTTTGATALADVEKLPRGLLFWRALTHWLGGMGIIVLSLAVLPFLGVAGMQLYKAETSGPTHDRLTPRLADTAKALWRAYLLLTGLETLALWAAGMSLFDALCHSFATVATGGFSTKGISIEAYKSPLIEWIVVVFMFAAGVNFALHYRALQGRPEYWGNREFRAYLLILGTASAGCAAALALRAEAPVPLADAVRLAVFQVVSIGTCTGFSSANFELWPASAQFVLLTLMFVGGSAGSTAGGIKVVRVVLLFKYAYREFVRLVHPGLVAPVRLGRETVAREVLESVVAFFFLYVLIFVAASTAMTFLGLDIPTAISSVATTMGGVGPGLGGVGPYDNFQWIPAPGKWILILCMLLGRLELFTLLVVLSPAYWRR